MHGNHVILLIINVIKHMLWWAIILIGLRYIAYISGPASTYCYSGATGKIGLPGYSAMSDYV